MYADYPWTYVRREAGEYYVYMIVNGQGHIASITGWEKFGETCPVTDEHARLIALAPEFAEVLGDLLNWAAQMGGWNAPCWLRAAELRDALRRLPAGPRQGT